MSAQFSERLSPPDADELTPADEAAIEREAQRLCAEKLQDPLWWNSRLEEVNDITANLPGQLVRCMGNLAHLRKGEPFAFQAVTEVLCQIERSAKRDAATEARAEAEAAFERGEL